MFRSTERNKVPENYCEFSQDTMCAIADCVQQSKILIQYYSFYFFIFIEKTYNLLSKTKIL